MHTKLQAIIDLAIANKASDIHLCESVLPEVRVNGDLIDLTNTDLGPPDQAREIILSILTDEQREKFFKTRDMDLSVTHGDVRLRVNIYYQMGLVSAAMRVVLSTIPSMIDLSLPGSFNEFASMKQGFVLVTGPTGHGKSTTVASILNEINRTRKVHMVTIEDPIEYVLKPDMAMISQREIGSDTLGFSEALKSCLRQDPNVVYVGEMRDLETISSALTVAETGHLVFSTLHTNSAAQSIDRIVDVFPEGAKGQVRTQLASVISAVVSQRLVPTLSGGRVPALEIMMANPAVKNIIREGKTFMIDNIIQTSADSGMISLETSLAKLVHQGVVSEEVAMSFALRPSEFQNKLRSYR